MAVSLSAFNIFDFAIYANQIYKGKVQIYRQQQANMDSIFTWNMIPDWEVKFLCWECFRNQRRNPLSKVSFHLIHHLIVLSPIYLIQICYLHGQITRQNVQVKLYGLDMVYIRLFGEMDKINGQINFIYVKFDIITLWLAWQTVKVSWF